MKCSSAQESTKCDKKHVLSLAGANLPLLWSEGTVSKRMAGYLKPNCAALPQRGERSLLTVK